MGLDGLEVRGIVEVLERARVAPSYPRPLLISGSGVRVPDGPPNESGSSAEAGSPICFWCEAAKVDLVPA
jgi:hypothetical protein